MKTTWTSDCGSHGGVLITTMILMLLATGLAGTVLKYAATETRASRQSTDYQKAQVAAEAGLDYGIAKIKDIIMSYQLSPSHTQASLQTLLDAVPPPPPIGGYVYDTPGGQSAFRLQVETPVNMGIVTNGTVCRGSYGSWQRFSITCGALNTNSGTGVVLKQEVQAVGLHLIRFGVFYEQDLEILPGPTMTFAGPVHSNSDMYLGGPLEFYDRVSAHGRVFHRRKNDNSRPGDAKIVDENHDLKSMKIGSRWLDSDDPHWMMDSLERWDGNVMTRAHGVPKLSPPIDPLDGKHAIIDRGLATNQPGYNAATEGEKFYNKAALRIHVDSNNVLTAVDTFGNDKTPFFTNAVLQVTGFNGTSGDPEYAKVNGHYKFVTNGPVDVTQTGFFDAREASYIAPVDIYLDQLQSAFPELYDGTYDVEDGRGILYVTRDEPAGGGFKPAIRLRNGGSIIPQEGLTIATDLPVYIEGHYNTNHFGGTHVRPSLVAGDAVSLLSTEWQDARSTLGSGNGERRAESTTYNTVLMLGNQETTWGNYNGGLENVLRFLERWRGKTVQYRGSIICLWNSEEAVGEWYYGNGPNNDNSGRRRYDNNRVRYRYDAPNRDWGYDSLYRMQSPPGMTRVYGMEELLWSKTTWAEEGW